MPKKIDFLIFYEVKTREFESIVLLRNELVHRGYTVEYVSFFERHDWKKIAKYKNNVKVAVMPSLYHTKEVVRIVYQVAGKVDHIVNLRWEQIFKNATANNINYYAYPKNAAMDAIHCCWGDLPCRLLEKAGIKHKNIKITGAVQLDFLREEFNGYYLSKEELFNKYSIPANQPVIMFVSSFAVSTMNESDFKGYLETFDNDVEKSGLINFVNVERKSKEIICSWLIKLSRILSCTIIYRPHPVESDTKEIAQLLNANIRVIRDENIKQWIKCCDQIYMWYSTAAVEAYVANVPFSILRPLHLPEEDDLPIYKDVNVIETETDFINLAKEKVSNNSYEMSLNIESVSDYYSITELPAYIRTTELLVDVYSGKYGKFNWNKISFLQYFKLGIENTRVFVEHLNYLISVFFVTRNLLIKSFKERLSIRINKRNKFYSDHLITNEEFELMQKKLWNYQFVLDKSAN